MSDALKAYTFHGLTLKTIGDNAVGECPFCEKPDHFYVKAATGQFNCRRCQASGNVPVFLEQFWESSLGSMKTVPLQKLAIERGLDLNEMLTWGLKVSKLDGAFLLPMYNLKDKFANLARIVQINGKWLVYGTPGCKLHPFGTKQLQKQQKVLWITEGPWDGIALTFALRNVRQDASRWIAHNGSKIAIKSHGVIAVPGAGTFAAEWLQLFAERDVRLIFDNDHPTKSGTRTIQPGWDGMQRVAKLHKEADVNSSKLQILEWGKKGFDPAYPTGFDVRDLSHVMTPQQMLPFLCNRLRAIQNSSPEKNGDAAPDSIQPTHCETFDDLAKYFEEHLHFTDNMRLALVVCLATVASTNLAGEQLWFRIIGPPGSGKTTLAECISVVREHCIPISLVTGLHSGVRKSKRSGMKEPSLIPDMNGKCVIWKDADTLISAPNKDKILSEFRDMYDGVSRARYRTGKQSNYEHLRNTFLFCGTDALRGLNRSFLGERFLDCDILGDSPTGEYLDSAMSSAFAAVEGSLSGSEAKGTHSQVLKQATYGFILSFSQRIIDRKVTIPTASLKIQTRLKAMAQLLAFTRARVEREREEMSYRPRTEIATRLIKQFAKLATCLAIILDRKEIDKQVMEIMAKVLHDTSHGYPYECIEYLYANPTGKSTVSICMALGLAETTIRRLVDDLQELGIIIRRDESNNSGVGGRNLHLWFLSREVRDVFKTSKGL